MAGMLWTKQYYYFDAFRWLEGHQAHPLLQGRRAYRNHEWFHMVNDDVLSMPDKWEYPWYAAWDLAFHTIALAVVDIDFAKQQMETMLSGRYLHPNGQVPAYEWNFSDVNPPVHAWATLFLHRSQMARYGEPDLEFLKSAFGKLLVNFTWWVNRKDRFGKNVFEGGFLGLDNISVFDRSAPLPTGGYLEQADGTAWMTLFAQNMGELAIEIAGYDPIYEDLVTKFIDHILWIAGAMNREGPEGMWDEEDGFYYDLLRLPDGSATRLKVRSMVGLLPLAATTVIEPWQRERIPRTARFLQDRIKQIPAVMKSLHPTGAEHLGVGGRGIIALLNPDKLRRILARMLDENEFLSAYGIRSLSKYHQDHPYVFNAGGQEYRVDYLPAESNTGLFGGNSNWRGPIWFPVNAVILRALIVLLHVLWRQLQGRMPDRFGAADEPVRGGQGDNRAACQDLPARRARTQAGLWRRGEVPVRPPLARSSSLLRVFPRRQRCRHRRQPSDRMDRLDRRPARDVRPPRPATHSGRGENGLFPKRLGF